MFPPRTGSKAGKSPTTLTAVKCNVMMQSLDEENDNWHFGWKTSLYADASHTGLRDWGSAILCRGSLTTSAATCDPRGLRIDSNDRDHLRALCCPRICDPAHISGPLASNTSACGCNQRATGFRTFPATAFCFFVSVDVCAGV